MGAQRLSCRRPRRGRPRSSSPSRRSWTPPRRGGGGLVHHLVLLLCRKNPEFDAWKAGRPCPGGRVPNWCGPESVFGWARGGKPLLWPDVAGFPLGAAHRFFLLQVHYDNPTAAAGVVDATAVRLHTASKARPQDSGTIWLGNLGITIGGERLATRNYTYTCPSECTSQLAGPVTVFYSALHAHYTATQMWTNVYRNGSFYRTVEAVKHWSNEHQRPTLFSPFTLLPGDRLTVSAEYNVDKLVASGDPAPAWGLGTHDEMLLTALFVYPRPTRVGPNTTVGDTLTACGGVFLPDAGEQWTICSGRQAAGANASAAVEGIDVFNRSALAVPDEAGWADPFNEAPACAAGTDGGGDAGAAGGHGPPPRIVHEANLAEYTAASRVVYERSQRRVEGVDGGGGVGGKAPPESALSEAEREHAKGNRWFVGATVAAFGAYRAVGDEY
eukprot:TRINITY_DN2444_c0_g1_i2.p1 TRINITY_DN2444_c0_g1~~TRINITY_DN2444_c0_g1_i2.p1  ORF type:complete len:442 (-),score=142.72 TRINITY_DN2444_c0_g1_i2:41-1366(-)